MIAENLLSHTIIPLRTSDTGEEALTMMNIFHVKHLPVIENNKVVSLISEEFLSQQDLEAPISSYTLNPVSIYSKMKESLIYKNRFLL